MTTGVGAFDSTDVGLCCDNKKGGKLFNILVRDIRKIDFCREKYDLLKVF